MRGTTKMEAKMEEFQLKPCPFCGAPAVRLGFLDNNMKRAGKDARVTRYVGCLECSVVSFMRVTDAECIAAWNRRAK